MRFRKRGGERDSVHVCVLEKQQSEPKQCNLKLANPNWIENGKKIIRSIVTVALTSWEKGLISNKGFTQSYTNDLQDFYSNTEFVSLYLTSKGNERVKSKKETAAITESVT